MRIIALHGKAGAGKDTFADRLVEKHNFVKRGFADPLYEEVAAAFGVTIAWLKDRTRKEVPQKELALVNCGGAGFRGLGIFASREHFFVSRSPRQILQWWGTDYRRAQDVNYWLNKMTAFVNDLNGGIHADCQFCPEGKAGVVVPDCRFENEAQWAVDRGGMVIEIVRGVPGVNPHPSERPLPRQYINSTVSNTRDLAWLRFCADYVGYGPNW